MENSLEMDNLLATWKVISNIIVPYHPQKIASIYF